MWLKKQDSKYKVAYDNVEKYNISLHHTAMKNAKGAVSALSHTTEKSFPEPDLQERKSCDFNYQF